jgi:hypothetical protein
LEGSAVVLVFERVVLTLVVVIFVVVVFVVVEAFVVVALVVVVLVVVVFTVVVALVVVEGRVMAGHLFVKYAHPLLHEPVVGPDTSPSTQEEDPPHQPQPEISVQSAQFPKELQVHSSV